MTPEEKDKLTSKFFAQADILLWLWDKDLNLIDVNKATLDTFHFKKEDIIGKNMSEISPDSKSSGRYYQYMEVIRTGETLILDEVSPHPSMGNFHFRLKAFKVGDGLGSALNNITDLKETIDEMETLIYKSSHDMRTPISNILGLANLADKVTDIEEAKQFYTMVKQQAERLDKMLHTIVETTRIRNGEKIIHLIDLNKLVDEVLDFLSLNHGFKEILFQKDIRMVNKFYSDKRLVISLFQNLIDNAIKYRNEMAGNSFIKITVRDETGGILITIADNGIGIPVIFQKDVFKMFFRATQKSSGSGLGLYTVARTIKKLGGQLKLNSEEDVGTRFTIYLPNDRVS